MLTNYRGLEGLGPSLPIESVLTLEPAGSELGSGKDATAFATAPGLVYRKGHQYLNGIPEEAMPLIANALQDEINAYDSLPSNVQASRTLIAWLADNRIHKIIEEASGKPLFVDYPAGTVIYPDTLRSDWEAGISAMAAVPQTHFDKVVADEAKLRERKILVDYAGPQNFFYDPVIGFTIIDAEFRAAIPLRGKSMYIAFIDGFTLATNLMGHSETWEGRISSQSRDNTITVLEKLNASGHRPELKLLFKSLCQALNYEPSR